MASIINRFHRRFVEWYYGLACVAYSPPKSGAGHYARELRYLVFQVCVEFISLAFYVARAIECAWSVIVGGKRGR